MAWGFSLSTEAKAGLLGLLTNVSCLQAPPGALLEAENVVFRRAGCAETRDGVKLLATTGQAAWGFSWVSSDVVGVWRGTDFGWSIIGGASLQYSDPVIGAVDPQPFRRDMFNVAELRGNTYFPYDSGVLKLTSAPAFAKAGLPLYAGIGLGPSVVGTWLPASNSVGYRVVVTRTDEHGLITRSIPSGAQLVTDLSGAPSSVRVSLGFHVIALGLFDAVEVYRTRNFAAGITVDDEMQLVATIPQSAFALTPPLYSYSFEDLISPTARGATLYTSPSRGGIEQRNNPPPAAACIAQYKQALFFGNVRGPQQKTFSFTQAVWTGSATGVGARSYTGDVTATLSTIINLSSTVGLERGQLVRNANFPDDTYITNIVGTTATVSHPSTGTVVGTSVSFRDAVKIDGIWIEAANAIDAVLDSYGTGKFIAYQLTPALGGNSFTWVVETVSRLAGSDTIQATHGAEYTPPLPNYLGTPMELDQDVFPGGLMWAKTDEPEHVAPVNFAFVGDSSRATLGLVPTRDALYILKEDGVWRLTGVDGTWAIDPYDPTLLCVLPSSVKPLNGRAYFLSSNGVVAFSDAGPDNVSRGIFPEVRPLIDQARANQRSTGFYELDNVIGSTSAVYDREDEYTLLRSDVLPPLVFNENTRAWSTWKYAAAGSEFLSHAGLFYLEREGRVAYGLGYDLYVTRLSTDSQLGVIAAEARNDRETAITVSSYTPASGYVTLSAPVTALEDDVIQDAAGVLWRVVNDVNGSVTVYVNALTVSVGGSSLDFTTGACVMYRSIRAKVTPQPFAQDPSLPKKWRRISTAFELLDGPIALRYAFDSSETPRTSLTPDWDQEDAVLVLDAGRAQYTSGYAYAGYVPNAHVHAWMLRASARWVQSHGTARLGALYAMSEPREEGGRHGRSL
jgi:hypothetical protein